MNTLDTTALERCLATLERAHGRLVVTSPADDDHDLFRAACVKEFELILEIVVKLLRKVLREYVTSTSELNNLPFKHILRLAAQHGLLSLDEVDRWLLHRDNRNTSAHEYGMQFAEQIINTLPLFIADTHAVLTTLRKQA
ncbi:MAG TPA: nucleotidyltransferase substrate binding protein [Hymenobacter sp.]|jgi:nucleotidyltransferase substrate binding protein (TIGR01987 family)|uniref:nucleotidyltransferase substrate binding protein n=1 Tax=Hymenobacter sp. TaxID=1898978 RepID=UPI002ED9718E